MYETSRPTFGRSQRVTCTGFANAVQPAAGKGKTFMVQARADVAGTTPATVGNTDQVIMQIGESGVGTSSFTGMTLGPGEIVVVNVDDLSQLYFRGANGDSVNITRLA